MTSQGLNPEEARLPLIHARQLASTMHKLARSPRKMRNLENKVTGMWHETGAQRKGTIRKETRFVDDASEWILSGPHIFVGNPFFQTPNEGVQGKQSLQASRFDHIAGVLSSAHKLRSCLPRIRVYAPYAPNFLGDAHDR